MKVVRKPPQPLDGWYESVSALALAHFDCDRAGIALRGACGTVITLAASDDVVEAADRLQAEHADGPAVCPAWRAAQVAVTDVAHHGPWPAWESAIARLGVHSVLATQIVTPTGLTGALTLYYESPVELTNHKLALARALAQQVAGDVHLALSAVRLLAGAEARTRIGQAQGLLMERFGLTSDEALVVLRGHAVQTNTRLREIAECLVARRDLETRSVGGR